MGLIKRKKEILTPVSPVLSSTGKYSTHPFGILDSYTPFCAYEYELYRSLREAVPVIDAAIYKLVRLVGGFKVTAVDERFNPILDEFVSSVPSDSAQTSLNSFIDTFFEGLLTYGTAVGEMLTDSEDRVAYLYNAPIKNIALRRSKDDFRRVEICLNSAGEEKVLPSQDKLLYSVLNCEAGSLTGTSILRGLPYVSSLLLKVFNAVGANWDRVGNVRFAVTYKPGTENSSKAFARERAMQIAEEWGNAMKSSEVRDFIAVGDVDIKVIGADNQVLDSEIPVRQLLEQIVAKLSLPPFMFGLSWSTTERMSQQQSDALTTELEHYRRILTPVIRTVCARHLLAYGYTKPLSVEWDDIMLKDRLDEANAQYLMAKTEAIYGSTGKGKGEKNE
ncbi:MAG: serine/threonine protein phosphatase [Ruminococcaceae bacterium]|nr:serine/threonine protein phosphatase [Oscillospiraceae bacterium]